MTNQPTEPPADKLRVAVCEALGWEIDPAGSWTLARVKRPDGIYIRPTDPRVPLESLLPPLTLDLMHEAEKTIETENQFTEYLSHLIVITGDGIPISATAEQRAMAFLRVRGLWKE